jgi:hypothetical protein
MHRIDAATFFASKLSCTADQFPRDLDRHAQALDDLGNRRHGVGRE